MRGVKDDGESELEFSQSDVHSQGSPRGNGRAKVNFMKGHPQIPNFGADLRSIDHINTSNTQSHFVDEFLNSNSINQEPPQHFNFQPPSKPPHQATQSSVKNPFLSVGSYPDQIFPHISQTMQALSDHEDSAHEI